MRHAMRRECSSWHEVTKASKETNVAKKASGFSEFDINEAAGPLKVPEMRAVLQGSGCYSPARAFTSEKDKKEDHNEFDLAHWRERAHTDASGNLVMPTSAFHLGLLAMARQSGEKIVGRGNKTYQDAFATGIVVSAAPGWESEDGYVLLRDAGGKPIHVDRVACDARMVPSDGVPSFLAKAGSKRVLRRFPIVGPGWNVGLVIAVLSQSITRDVLSRHLRDAGLVIGVGRWRPQSRGNYGRFAVTKAEWKAGE